MRERILLLCTVLGFASGCAALLQIDDYSPSGSSIERDASLPPVDGAPQTDAHGATCGDAPCRPHEVCVAESARPICRCAAGYVLEGDACVFRGGPRDPTFENTPAAWVVAGNAGVRPAASGARDPGEAALSNAGSIRQAFEMPSLASAEPLALDLVALGACGEETRPFCYAGDFRREVSFGRGAYPFSVASGSYGPTRICLGELAYGPGASVEFTSDQNNRLWLDHAAYVADPTCPPLATLRNGDFESVDGWTRIGNAAFADGVGTAASRAGRLFTTTCNDTGALTTEISVPATSVGAAIRFSQKGPTTRQLEVFGAAVRGKGSSSVETVCLPRFARGYVASATFRIVPVELAQRIDGQGCSTPSTEFIIDDVSFVSSPGCAEPGYAFGGDFEGAVVYGSFEVVGPMLAEVRSGLISNSGVAAIRLEAPANAAIGAARFRTSITVPPPSGAAGPAAKFWYEVSDVGEVGGFNVNGKTLTSTVGSVGIVCLPPSRIDRSYDLVFSFATQTTASVARRAWVDDIVVTTDPSCPAR